MLRSFFRLFISFGLLALIVYHADITKLSATLESSQIMPILIATLAIVVQIFFLNLRWHSFLNAGRYIIPYHRSVLINLASYFANIVFITSIGGIIAKSGLAIQQGISIIHAIFATFIDRMMTLLALIIFTALSLPVLATFVEAKLLFVLTAIVIGSILSIVFFLLIMRSGLISDYMMATRTRSRFFATLRTFTENPKLMMATSLHSLLAQGFFFISTYILSQGFDYGGTEIQFLALLPAIALVSALPISFGGWGVREGAFVFALGMIGFSMEDAFFLSIQVGLVTLVAPFIVALPYLINKEHNLVFFIQSSKTTKSVNSAT